MSITHSTLTSLFTDIADAIRAKTGKTSTIVADNFPSEIIAISSDKKNDVIFYDYDGTQLYSYTAEAFTTLTELPDNPIHNGLIAQGWNWTLSDAKTYVATYGALDIGQMYTTASGATEIDITLTAPALSPYLLCSLSGPIDIDWGDNSEIQHVTTTGQQAIQHIYSAAGNYTIILSSEEQNITFSGNFYPATAGVFSTTNAANKDTVYSSTIQAVRLGNNIILGTGAFDFCLNMKSITIPSGISIIPEISFYECTSLKTIVIPNTVTKIDSSAFDSCVSLSVACLPSTVTIIEQAAFRDCLQMTRILLPSSIATINDSAFLECYSLKNIILPSSVTTLGSEVFAYNSNLSSANCANSGALYCQGLFTECPSLKAVSLPHSIKTLEDTFFRCYSLQSISIPASVTKIYSLSFTGCTSLSEIHFNSSTPPTITDSNIFSSIPANCIIYVPTGKLSVYTSATNYPSSTTYTYMEE